VEAKSDRTQLGQLGRVERAWALCTKGLGWNRTLSLC
jgi:hypothetical protein